jgi:inner membrane protein YidH
MFVMFHREACSGSDRAIAGHGSLQAHRQVFAHRRDSNVRAGTCAPSAGLPFARHSELMRIGIQQSMAPELDRVRDHLANERTFLAWVRTAIGIIVFGFAIGRFGLALRQLAAAQHQQLQSTGMGLSVWFGSGAMLFGVVVAVSALLRFRRTKHQIEQNSFSVSVRLVVIVSVLTVLFGLGLIAYLLRTGALI